MGGNDWGQLWAGVYRCVGGSLDEGELGLISVACKPTSSYHSHPQVFTTFTSRLAADALAFTRPADLDALDACAQQLAQVGQDMFLCLVHAVGCLCAPAACNFLTTASLMQFLLAPRVTRSQPHCCHAGAGRLPGAARHQCRGAQGGRSTAGPAADRVPRAAGRCGAVCGVMPGESGL